MLSLTILMFNLCCYSTAVGQNTTHNVSYFKAKPASQKSHLVKNRSLSEFTFSFDELNRKKNIELINNKVEAIAAADDEELSLFDEKLFMDLDSVQQQQQTGRQRMMNKAHGQLDNVYYIDFELNVNELTNFEPKSGHVELDLNLMFKWWPKQKPHPTPGAASPPPTPVKPHQPLIPNYFPSILLRNTKNNKILNYFIKNQLHTVNNAELVVEEIEPPMPASEVILNKLDKFKRTNSVIQAGANRSSAVFATKTTRQFIRYYSCLEQNVTVKFRCKSDWPGNQHNRRNNSTGDDVFDDETDDEESESNLDQSRFPFDSHICEIDLDLLPTQLSTIRSASNATTVKKPIFLFSWNRINNKNNPNRLFRQQRALSDEPQSAAELYPNEQFVDFYKLAKLVNMPNNYSLIAREWLLKKLVIFYKNSSLPDVQPSGDVDDIRLLDQIMLLNQNSTSTTGRQQPLFTPASLSLKFFIYRKREPQVYIFLLPLVLFTLVTFLIFFLPTSNTSEKTLISFLNFISLLAYNLYLFKLIIYVYEFERLPLILQYSNCLMLIQLGVLAYTCLVKSIYHSGFLTFSSSKYDSFFNLADESYRQILFMNNSHNVSNAEGQLPDLSDLFTDNNNLNNGGNMPGAEIYHGLERRMSHHSSVKIKVPVIKLDDYATVQHQTHDDLEQMNGISQIAHDDNYVTYTHIESSLTSAPVPSKCPQCGEVTAAGEVNSGSGICSNGYEHESNKMITIRNDLFSAQQQQQQQHCLSSSSGNSNKLISSELISRSNSNKLAKYLRLGSKCCSGQNAGPTAGKQSPPLIVQAPTGYLSPSPICEHVREKDNTIKNMPKITSSSAVTHQVMPMESSTSHLNRIKQPGLKQTESLPAAFGKCAAHKCAPINQRVNFTNVNNNNNNNKPAHSEKNNKIELMNKLMGNTSFEITKLNLNVQKLIKIEEIYVKEKLQKEDWQRKARICDGICCLFVFFLLVVCSIFIFIILPSVKTASLVD